MQEYLQYLKYKYTNSSLIALFNKYHKPKISRRIRQSIEKLETVVDDQGYYECW